MKKIFTLFIVLIVALFIAGCAAKEAPQTAAKPVEAPAEPKETPVEVEVIEIEPEAEPEDPVITDPDYFKMSSSEFGDTIEVKNVDTTIDGLAATLDKVHLVVRNFDVEGLQPRIVVQLTGGNNIHDSKEFFLDPLPKGYMMRKKLDMEGMMIQEAKLMKIVTVTLIDDNQNLKEIAQGKMEFIPIV